MLAAHVPDLEVHVVEGDGGDVLADGRDGGFGGGGGLVVEGFDGGEEGRFAGVVEAEEEDGVFWERVRGAENGKLAPWRSEWLMRVWGEEEEGTGADVPSLAVAQKYTLLARWYMVAAKCRLWVVCARAAAQVVVGREAACLDCHR